MRLISVHSMTSKFKSDGFIKQLFEYFSKTDKLDKLQRIISMGINMDDEDQEDLLEEIEENLGKKVIKRTRKDELNN